MSIFQDKLNSIDYSFKDYVPSKNALVFANFIKEVERDNLENPTPLTHMQWFDAMFSSDSRVIGCCHRGFAKTTSIEYLFLYLACFGELGDFGKVNFAIYVGDTIENGVKNLRKNIEARYQRSEFLQKMIPNNAIRATATDRESSVNADGFESGRKFTDVRIEFRNINGEPFVVRGYGANVGIRGSKELGLRPQLAVIDDILNDEDSRSDTIIEHLNNVVYKAVNNALHPQRNKVIWLGTPFNSRDPLYTAVESGTWKPILFPVCEKFPCERNQFKGSWEDRFNYEFIERSYLEAVSVGRPDHFYQELMLQIIPETDRIVTEDHIQWVQSQNLLRRNESYNYYITTDFAVTEKTTSDYSVISVWAITHNEDYILVDGIAKRQPIDETINQLLAFCSKYKPLQVGIEVTGQQLGFITFIKNEQIRTNIFFNIAEVRPKKDKLSRFLEISPLFNRNKIFLNRLLPEEFKIEFKDEIAKATHKGIKSKHDDILDTISMLNQLEIYVPSQTSLPLEIQETTQSIDNYYFGDNSEVEPKEDNGSFGYSSLIF